MAFCFMPGAGHQFKNGAGCSDTPVANPTTFEFSAAKARAFSNVESNIFVFKTRSATRGIVSIYNAGRKVVGLAPGIDVMIKIFCDFG
jgi:hypothetical protein